MQVNNISLCILSVIWETKDRILGGQFRAEKEELRLLSAEGAKEESSRDLPPLVHELSLYKYRDLMLATALFLYEHEKTSISVGR